MEKKHLPSKGEVRPPVVAVLGHVDHGKTTLLDYIRSSQVAAREHGGITQHIGAYQVKVKSAGDRQITFIDTPGHEAFAAMRSRGAKIADVAVLVVAADDSVKPQTVESLRMIKEAGVPFVVAVNKIDLPTANLEKVKQDLAKHGVQVEGFGGDIPWLPVSGKKGTGVNELLNLLVLIFDMQNLPADMTGPLETVVIETRLDKGKGMTATLIIKKGTLTRGTTLYEQAVQVGKVRAMFDEHGQAVTAATPGQPVEVLGFSSLPAVGVVLGSVPVFNLSAKPNQAQPVLRELPDFLKPLAEQAKEQLLVILKADTAGSLEAIIASLSERIKVVSAGVGEITEADVLQARSSRALVIGFNVKASVAVTKLAQTEKVIVRIYTIIYELLDELTEVVAGLKEVLAQERQLGAGRVIAEFPFDGQRIAGTKVLAGRLAKGDQVKVMRDETEIGRAKLKSVRRGKDDVTKVEEGNDCGLLFDKKVDFQIGDAIIAFTFH